VYGLAPTESVVADLPAEVTEVVTETLLAVTESGKSLARETSARFSRIYGEGLNLEYINPGGISPRGGPAGGGEQGDGVKASPRGLSGMWSSSGSSHKGSSVVVPVDYSPRNANQSSGGGSVSNHTAGESSGLPPGFKLSVVFFI
jgi:hypothetical protein